MLAAATLLVAATSVSAFTGCSGQEIGKRNHGMGNPNFKARAYDPNVVDEVAQCTAYNYEPVSSIASQFPGNWVAATIPPTDTVAQGLFAELNKTIAEKVGNVAVKVGTQGDFSAYQYDNAADPDCWWSKTRCTTPKDTNIAADISRLPEPNTWGFGFDDGPNCSHNALYNFMKQEKQLASMFFIGSNVMNWPLQALRAKQDGHELCVHTWSHPAMTTMSNEGAFAELYYTREAIKAVTGVTPKCWRPPYGDVDNRIRAIAGFLNLTNVLWSDDTFDWQEGTQGITSDTIKGNYQKVIDKAKAGEYNTYGPIVLNHESNNKTMQHMIEQYPAIKAAFKYIVPIASGMNWTTPYVETNETYPDFNAYTSGQLTGGSVPADGGNSPGASTTGGGSGASAGAAASASAPAGSKAASASRTTAAGVLAVAGVVAAMLI